MRLKFLISALLLLLLPACSRIELASHVVKQLPGTTSKSQGAFKVGSPYKVAGKWYKPQETYSYTETGIASWYGPNFHGKKTANGEIFDMNELTAAHKTLQLPSLVRVTNLENGRSLIVRVNDRGPFKRGRIIDLSKRAADLLGFKNKGVAKVRVQVLPKESLAIAEAAKRGQDTRGVEVAMNENRLDPRLVPPSEPQASESSALAGISSESAPDTRQVAALESPPIHGHVGRSGNFYPDPVVKQFPVKPSNIYVQAGSFGNRANAQSLAVNLRSFGDVKVYPTQVNGSRFYRVRLGPVKDVQVADSLLERLASSGHTDSIIVVD